MTNIGDMARAAALGSQSTNKATSKTEKDKNQPQAKKAQPLVPTEQSQEQLLKGQEAGAAYGQALLGLKNKGPVEAADPFEAFLSKSNYQDLGSDTTEGLLNGFNHTTPESQAAFSGILNSKALGDDLDLQNAIVQNPNLVSEAFRNELGIAV